MKAVDARYAAELADALDDLPEVRKGLCVKPKHYDAMQLKIDAYAGDHDGGESHGNALLPAAIGPQIIDLVEKLIRAELKRLKVEP